MYKFRFRREVYRVTGKHKETSMELHPELTNKPGRFDSQYFSWECVKNYLADQARARTVVSRCVNLSGVQIDTGRWFLGQKTTIAHPVETRGLRDRLQGA